MTFGVVQKQSIHCYILEPIVTHQSNSWATTGTDGALWESQPSDEMLNHAKAGTGEAPLL